MVFGGTRAWGAWESNPDFVPARYRCYRYTNAPALVLSPIKLVGGEVGFDKGGKVKLALGVEGGKILRVFVGCSLYVALIPYKTFPKRRRIWAPFWL